MVNKCINIIFYNTVSIIIGVLGKEKKYVEAYKKYLKKNYERLLNDLVEQVGEEILKDAAEAYVESEKSFWSGLNEEGMLSELEEDLAFEYIKIISEAVFQQAIDCVKTGTFLNDEDEYTKQIEELNKNLKDVKYFNADRARTLISEGMLDIGYAFNKTKNMSLRLGSYI